MCAVMVEAPVGTVATDAGLLGRVLRSFGAGEVLVAGELTAGLMNRNWRVETAVDVFALKQVLDIDAAQAERQHRVTAALAAAGFAVPAPFQGSAGSTLVEVDGCLFALLPWIEGSHRSGVDLTWGECHLLGGLLARLHVWLADNEATLGLEPVPGSREIRAVEPGAAAARIDRLVELVNNRVERDSFDEVALDRLTERRRILARSADLWPGAREVGSIGWTHGDFHHLNILWSFGAPRRLVGVLDWDRFKVQPLAWEIARAANLLFGYDDGSGWALDLGRISAFVGGYRHVNPLSDAEVVDAVHRLWWSRLCEDFWHLERHYHKADGSCDHLFVSACGVLSWWSEHRHDVVTAFTTTPDRSRSAPGR
jgi:homoserine kinase type II